MRTKKSAINIITAFISQFILILLGFISRKVMIDSVGVEYLGINGLMSNILTILSLAESGIGTAMIYALYKPLAEKNIPKIKALMNFYKNTYRALALFTALLGMSILPFLKYLMKDNTVENSIVIYLLFLFSSVCSYLYSYKISMNNADQNKYLSTIFNTVTQILVLVAKVLILYLTKNYILFLSIDIASTLIKNFIFSKMMDKRYPYLKEKVTEKLDKETKDSLYVNIKSLFIGKIGYIISVSSDNLVISSRISIKTMGLYSNYTTITSAVSGFVGIFISSISASIGNLLAEESKEKVYDIYKTTEFINFWLYFFSSICIFCLSETFISLWIGEQFIMGKGVLLLIVLNFFISGIMAPIDSVKCAAGLYKPDRYVTIIAAVVNFIISMVLAKPLGISGVFIGTLVSTLLFSFWIKPVIVYKYIFKKNVFEYFKRILFQISITFIMGSICLFVGEEIFNEYTIINLLCKLVLCIIISNIVFVLIYFRTQEYKYVYNIASLLIKKLKFKSRDALTDI
ncbi:hypothetical protein ABFP60_07820 [Clostridioides difficile]